MMIIFVVIFFFCSPRKGLPLPPMSPLWREHGKSEGGGGIHIVVCCCNEEEEELKVRVIKQRRVVLSSLSSVV